MRLAEKRAQDAVERKERKEEARKRGKRYAIPTL